MIYLLKSNTYINITPRRGRIHYIHEITPRIVQGDSFVDNRHFYLGYIEVRNFWVDCIKTSHGIYSSILTVIFTDHEIEILRKMVSSYLKCEYTVPSSYNNCFTKLPCTSYRPSENSKIIYTDSTIVHIKTLQDFEYISGYVTLRIFNPRHLGCYDNDINITGISIIESKEVYEYIYHRRLYSSNDTICNITS